MFYLIEGYGCITQFKTKAGENKATIERQCQNTFYQMDKFEFSDMIEIEMHQQPYCYTDDTAFEDGIAETELECYCFGDLCNVAANDLHLPVLQSTGNVDCKAEYCTPSGCVNMGLNGVCKGKYCYIGHYFC